MTTQQRVRLYAETVIGGLAGVLGVLSIFWQDWIEGLTGWDPDNGSGGLEWAIVAGLLVVAVVVGGLARRDWRRSRATPEGAR